MPLPAIAAAAAPLVSGALSFWGGERQNVANARMAREQMAHQDRSTREQMAFQKEMSGTSYQRAVADLKAAGLNPALAYQQGGASSPSGASSSGASAQMVDSISPALNSAQSVTRTRSDLETARAQRGQVAAATAASVAQADATAAEAENTRARTATENLMRAAALAELMSRTKGNIASANRTRRLTPFEVYTERERGHTLWESRLLAESSRPDALRLLQHQVSLAGSSAQAARFALPGLRNQADFANSWFGSEIAPYLGSAGDVARILGSIGVGAGALRGLRFGPDRRPDPEPIPDSPRNRVGF